MQHEIQAIGELSPSPMTQASDVVVKVLIFRGADGEGGAGRRKSTCCQRENPPVPVNARPGRQDKPSEAGHLRRKGFFHQRG